MDANKQVYIWPSADSLARVQLPQAQPDGGGPLSPEATAEISRAIRRSNSQLEVATGAFAACKQATSELAAKYR